MKQAASGVCRNQRVPAQLVSTEALSAQTCLFADVPEGGKPSSSTSPSRGQSETHRLGPKSLSRAQRTPNLPEPQGGEAAGVWTARQPSGWTEGRPWGLTGPAPARPRPGPGPLPCPRLRLPAPGSRRAPAPSGRSCPAGSAHPAFGPPGPPRRVGGGGDRNRPARSLGGALPYSAGGSSDELRKIQVLCWVHGCRRYTTKRKEKHDPSFRHVKKIEFPEDFISRKEALIMWNRNTRRLLSAQLKTDPGD
ncbi:translation initiation factor IF-2-like [Acinonyx jubatus]|uniref:Translation initiation factor IF-2-like n=1 Tax=Acinonyx jubatus TaxID=32536 RepID=A0ABM3QAV7_ACIJB|nr:translation initiation factor IF-2-like [Acinonyx jubatus]